MDGERYVVGELVWEQERNDDFGTSERKSALIGIKWFFVPNDVLYAISHPTRPLATWWQQYQTDTAKM